MQYYRVMFILSGPVVKGILLQVWNLEISSFILKAPEQFLLVLLVSGWNKYEELVWIIENQHYTLDHRQKAEKQWWLFYCLDDRFW